MDSVQNCDSYKIIPSSQTYRSYLIYLVSNEKKGTCRSEMSHSLYENSVEEGSYGHRNERSGFIKCWLFLNV
jgi:hypothetical protein